MTAWVPVGAVSDVWPAIFAVGERHLLSHCLTMSPTYATFVDGVGHD